MISSSIETGCIRSFGVVSHVLIMGYLLLLTDMLLAQELLFDDSNGEVEATKSEIRGKK